MLAVGIRVMGEPNGLFASQVSKAEAPALLCIHCYLENLLPAREYFYRKLEMTSEIPLCRSQEWVLGLIKKTFGAEIENGQPINC